MRGPFTAARIVTWMDKDFFPADMEVREERKGRKRGRRPETKKNLPAHSHPDVQPTQIRQLGRDFTPLNRITRTLRAQAVAQGDGGGRGGDHPTHSEAIARRLFTAGAALATDEPMWRYRDPSGTVQGPFPAGSMVEWYGAGYLGADLPTCGASRKVGAPHLPLACHYAPLAALLASVARGEAFHPLTLEKVKADAADPAKVRAPVGGGGGGRGASRPGAGAAAVVAGGAAAAKGKGGGGARDGAPAAPREPRAPRPPRGPHPAVRDLVGAIFAKAEGKSWVPPVREERRDRKPRGERPAAKLGYGAVRDLVGAAFAKAEGKPWPPAPPSGADGGGGRGGGGRVRGGDGANKSPGGAAAAAPGGRQDENSRAVGGRARGRRGGEVAPAAGALGAGGGAAALAPADSGRGPRGDGRRTGRRGGAASGPPRADKPEPPPGNLGGGGSAPGSKKDAAAPASASAKPLPPSSSSGPAPASAAAATPTSPKPSGLFAAAANFFGLRK